MITYIGVAHPWMCDAMGHLNVRYYAAMFDDASVYVLGYLAAVDESGPRFGWADVRSECQYSCEVAGGTVVRIQSRIERVGQTSVGYAHEMFGAFDDILRASASVISVRFDLDARCKIELHESVRQRAAGFAGVDRVAGPPRG